MSRHLSRDNLSWRRGWLAGTLMAAMALSVVWHPFNHDDRQFASPAPTSTVTQYATPPDAHGTQGQITPATPTPLATEAARPVQQVPSPRPNPDMLAASRQQARSDLPNASPPPRSPQPPATPVPSTSAPGPSASPSTAIPGPILGILDVPARVVGTMVPDAGQVCRSIHMP